jgi:hypothetical protein
MWGIKEITFPLYARKDGLMLLVEKPSSLAAETSEK